MLPDLHDLDSLQILAQNPTTLFLYWHVSERKMKMAEQHFECGWNDLPKRIRLYEITHMNFDGSEARSVRELPVPGHGSCYIRDLAPAAAYVADLGVTNIHNQFIPLLQSNTLSTSWTSPEEAGRLLGPTRSKSEKFFLTLLPEDYGSFSAYSLYEPRS